MTSACAALRELPEVWEEDTPERALAILQAMTPPDELQEYHATLTEFLTFVARTGDGTDLYAEAEALNRVEAHFIAAQQLPPPLRAVIAQDCPPGYTETMEDWTPEEGQLLPGPGQTDRLTIEEYLDGCADFMGVNLEFDEEPSWDVLEAILTNLVEEASLVAPPAELVEYHQLVVAWLALTLESILAARQEELTPDDPDARGHAAAVYLQFKNLGLALSPTLRLMDPSLKEALAERGCLIEE